MRVSFGMHAGWGHDLISLALAFAPLSLISFGGSNVVLADIAHQAIAAHHWTGEQEFADLFAISRAAPGPGSMLVALIGWKVAGLAGAAVATASLYLPPAVLVYAAARVWGRWRGSAWHAAVERGLAPIAAGLLLSGGIAVLRLSAAGPALWLAALAAMAALLRWPRLHPVPILLAGGAVFGVVNLV
ncbi:MAG TPA: chromate transporter [Stellaceae bacterium]|nr:chromate transporter [Stellaceae bacterium]